MGEDDEVEQIRLLQRRDRRGEGPFDRLELAALHARRDIDDKGQAARQGIALGQLGHRGQPQGIVSQILCPLRRKAEHGRFALVVVRAEGQGEVLPGRHLFVAEEDLGAVIVGPGDLGEP